MTPTSRRLRALASTLCQFEEADRLTLQLFDDAQYGRLKPSESYMWRANWNGPLSKWRKTVQQELESIYAEHQSASA